MSDTYREWDAAYVLGALSADERREFEKHLDGCDRCRGSVAELAGIPGILAKLPVADAVEIAAAPEQPAGESPFPELGIVQRLARAEVRRRRRSLIIALAAGLIVVGSLGGLWASNAFAPSVHLHEMTALGQDVVTAQVAVVPEAYGSRIVWSCQYPSTWKQSFGYDLVVIDAAGAATTVATWSSAGNADGLTATTAIPATAIRAVEIRLTGEPSAVLREQF
jgi:hypothetical protein